MPSGRGRPFFLRTKTDLVRSQTWDQSCPKIEDKIVERGVQLFSSVAVVSVVAKEDGLHDCIRQSGRWGSRFSKTAITSPADKVMRGKDCAIEASWAKVRVSRYDGRRAGRETRE